MHAIHLPFIYPRPAPQTDLFPRDTAGFPSPSSPPSSRPPPSWSVTQTPFAQAPIARTPLLGPPAPSDPIALGSYRARTPSAQPTIAPDPYRSDPLHRSDPLVARTPSLKPTCSDPIARTQSLGPNRSDPVARSLIARTPSLGPSLFTPSLLRPPLLGPQPLPPPIALTHSLGSMAAARTRLCLHARAADPRLVCVVLCHVCVPCASL